MNALEGDAAKAMNDQQKLGCSSKENLMEKSKYVRRLEKRTIRKTVFPFTYLTESDDGTVFPWQTLLDCGNIVQDL